MIRYGKVRVWKDQVQRNMVICVLDASECSSGVLRCIVYLLLIMCSVPSRPKVVIWWV